MVVFDEDNLDLVQVDEPEKPLVMFVDDEAENVNMLRIMFESKYEVITCYDGQEAWDVITSMTEPHKIHAIISDQQMPRLTGVELLEKTLEKIPNTVRMIMTGYSDESSIIDAINRARIYHFIMKPFKLSNVASILEGAVAMYKNKQEHLKQTN